MTTPVCAPLGREPQSGDVFQDRDKRMNNRRVRVVRTESIAPGVGYAFCANVADRSERPRVTRIAFHTLRQRFEYVGTVSREDGDP